MKAKTTLLIAALLLPYLSKAGNNYPAGARSAGLANATVALADLYAVHHNQAGLGFLDQASIGFYAENKYFIEGIYLNTLSAAIPAGKGGFGSHISYFGYAAYNELKIGLSYGRLLTPELSAGIQFDYFSTRVSEYGIAHAFTIEAGILYFITKDLCIGAHIFNPVRAGIGESREPMPVIMRVGLAYNSSEKVTFLLETEKDLQMPPVFKGGIEYRLTDVFSFRAGAGNHPVLFSFGTGIHLKSLQIDIAASHHQVLGISPHFGLIYIWEN